MPIRQTSQPLMGRRKYYIELVCITTVHTMLLCNSQCQPCNSRAYSAIPVPTVQTWHSRHGNATAFYLCPILYQSFAFAMIDLIPTQTPAVHTDQNTLDDAVGNTISTYNQFCTPIPFYPRQLPTCV